MDPVNDFVDFLTPVTIDNFVEIEVDAGGDGLADVGAVPLSRVVYHDVSTPAGRASWGVLRRRYR